MRRRFALWGLLLAVLVPVPTARAQCADAGSVANGTCTPRVVLEPLPGLTNTPLLEIDALVADDGSIIPPTGGQNLDAGVFVTVRGPGPDGGGTLQFLDGGPGPVLDAPLVTPLSLIALQPSDGGSPTLSLWGGNSLLFRGLNTITVTAREPSGVSVTSAPGMVWLVSTTECQDGGVPPHEGCNIVFTAELAPPPARTTIPVLDLNALITDDGRILQMGGPGSAGNVFVTVQGPGPNGGGTLVFLDGGTLPSASPFGTQLALIDYVQAIETGTPTYSLWTGATSLFEGLNTLTATATEYGGIPSVSSAPQTVFLDFGAPTDGGTDGGPPADGGKGGGSDGGSTDSGVPPTTDGGGDGGGGSPSTTTSQSGCGCSGSGDASPSFIMMALAVVLFGLRRRANSGAIPTSPGRGRRMTLAVKGPALKQRGGVQASGEEPVPAAGAGKGVGGADTDPPVPPEKS